MTRDKSEIFVGKFGRVLFKIKHNSYRVAKRKTGLVIKKVFLQGVTYINYVFISFFQRNGLMFTVPLGRKDCQTCKITETARDSTFESFSEE